MDEDDDIYNTPTRQHKVHCHACGTHTKTITVANAKFWARVARIEEVRAHPGCRLEKDTGKIRFATIGGHGFEFLQTDLNEHWPELADMFQRADKGSI